MEHFSELLEAEAREVHDCVCVCDWLKWVTNNKV